MENVQAYPLSWPPGFPRSKEREKGQFRTTLAGALKNVEDSIRLFGRDSGKPVSNVVLSSNVTLGATKPIDPGIALWFVWEGMQIAIPLDRYSTVEANLQALHHVIEARRTELRHGTLNLVKATFSGFRALPPPTGKDWRSILGIPASIEIVTEAMVNHAYRMKAQERHPDVAGGSTQLMAELNHAKDTALREIGA